MALAFRPWRLRQPTVAIVTTVIALGAFTAAWLVLPSSLTNLQQTGQAGLLAAVLIGSLALSYRFVIHIRYTTKIFMSTVPLYLMVTLLSPPISLVAVGMGTVLAESLGRKRGDAYPSDIATQAGRSMLFSLPASYVAHLVAPAYTAAYLLVLLLSALLVLAGDVLTAPFQACSITGERYGRFLVEVARGVGLPEAGQCALGILGAMIAIRTPWAVLLLFIPVLILYQVTKRAKEMHESTQSVLEAMADVVDERDPFTHQHSVRVTRWTKSMLAELGIIGPEAQLIVTAARLHDIGKMALPDEMIHKHENLTDLEWSLMQRHPIIGADIVQRYPAFARGAAIVRGHHERWDGQGYPDKLAGTNIPIGARILAVADSYDAMTSDRPYRNGMSPHQAAAILRGEAGAQWDPALVDIFLRVMPDQPARPALETAPVSTPQVATV
jgi:putative nucleotidyltransferase with HDIG domain